MPTPALDTLTSPNGLHGQLTVPGDKSISHRSLMFAGLVDGRSEVRGLLPSADVFSTRDCLRQLGVTITPIDEPSGHWEIIGKRHWDEPVNVLDCGNSGTTIRLMSGLISGMQKYAVMTGDKSLVKRPMGRVMNPLKQMNTTWFGKTGGHFAPMTFVPRMEPLRGIDYAMPVASAQVKSAVLLAGLFAQQEVIVREPLPSRDHTERMLTAMGADLKTDEGSPIHRLAPMQIDALKPVDWLVPGDPSSAAFPMVAALCCPNSDIYIENVGLNPHRDGLIRALQRIGANIEIESPRDVGGEPVGTLRVRYTELKGDITLEAADIPAMVDEIPILAVACVWLDGTLTVKGAEELRAKESDRLLAVATEFKKLGVHVDLYEDGLRLVGNPELCLPARATEPLSAWHDHRIAMALGVMNLIHNQRHPNKSTLWDIDDPTIVNVSFPRFYELMNHLQNA
jgi:3-phosphoshikimate 1-carboxyvinyltransferase